MTTTSKWPQQLRDAKEWLKGVDFPDDILAPFTASSVIDSVDDYLEWADERGARWVFRGQREFNWLLQTSLDRVSKRNLSDGYDHYPRRRSESQTLTQFKDAIRVSDAPAQDDLASWLCAMQHHSIPTRLLDWTYSARVSAYFALEKSPVETDASAVWALDLDWLEQTSAGVLAAKGLSIQDVNGLLSQREHKPLILRVEPKIVPRRMAAQEGLLLCKLVDEAHFDKIVVTMLFHCEPPPEAVVRRAIIPKTIRAEFLSWLDDEGIQRERLFPEPELDLYGTAAAAKLDAAIKDSIAAGESFWGNE